MKYLTSVFLIFFVFSFSIAQRKITKIDTVKAKLALAKSKKLYFSDALAARDITYEWTNDLYHTNNYRLRSKFNLQHAKNDEVCGSIEAAIEVYSRAINDALLVNNKSLVLAESYARRGNALNLKGESQLGLEDIIKAKSIYEYHNKSEEFIWCEVLIANCYLKQQSLIRAREKINRAINDLEQFSKSFYLLDAYFIYARIVWKEKSANPSIVFKPEIANTKLKTALRLAKKMANKPYEAKALKLLADIKNLEKKYEESLVLARRANKLFKETNFLVSWVGSKTTESLNLLNLGRHREVILNLEAPVELAAKSGWLTELNQMYSWLAVSHSTLGNHREGAINGSRAFTVYKHIVKQERELQMETLEANYEKEKQKRIAAEALKVAEDKAQQRNIVLIVLFFLLVIVIIISFAYRKINNKNKVLKKNLLQKEILTQEVHHRVKNNLTLLKSLLFLRASSSDNKDVKNALNECQARIQSMALVHENLYNIEDSSSVDFKLFLNQLLEEIDLMFNKGEFNVDIKLNVGEVNIEMRKAVFLGLILNEMITNSYKHAFHTNEENWIEIELLNKNNKLILNYSDSGAGFPNNFDVKNERGFGFKLINIIISQLDASILIRKEKLSSFKIEVPYEKIS